MSSGEVKRRIDGKEIRKSGFWREILKMEEEYKSIYGNLLKKVVKFLNLIDSYNLEDDSGIIFDFVKNFEKLKNYFSNFEFILQSND